ncbi:MAG: DUF115 domain-containing protein [Magnetococcales bacterium]|nr:DUF115 domain-containing protein [Magnetococcales bacterium]NGZ06532.1 DUF115 domain-containing protein [Magnetococcales bacterium]
MNDWLHANGQILAQRWPDVWAWLTSTSEPPRLAWEPDGTPLFEGRLLCSRHDRLHEARWQMAAIPEDVRQIRVYGVGSGEVVRLLLQRERLERLVVVPIHAAGAAMAWSSLDHRDWLQDPRITVQTPREHGDRPQWPWVVIPFELAHPCTESAGERLRSRLQFDLDEAIVNQDAVRLPWLQPHIDRNAPFWQQDADVATLAGLWQGQTVLIAAAGPSLADHFGPLRTARFPLIAVGAALKPLLAADIHPDVVITVDPFPITVQHFCTDLTPMHATTLVYFPATDPWVVANWPGPRCVASSDGVLYQNFRAVRPATTCLFTSGTVTHAAADLAVLLGAGRVVFLGADFAFPGGRKHVAGSAHRRDAVSSTAETVPNGWGEPVATLASLKCFLHDLEHLLARHQHVAWWQASRRGAQIQGCRYPEGSDLESWLAIPWTKEPRPPVARLLQQAQAKVREGFWSEAGHLLDQVDPVELPDAVDRLFLAMVCLHNGVTERAGELLTELIESPVAVPHVQIRVMALHGEMLAKSAPDEGLHLLRSALDLARAAGLIREEGFVQSRVARFCRQRGQLLAAERAWREAIHLTESCEEQPFFQVELADLLQQQQQAVAAEAVLHQALPVFERFGLVFGAAWARQQLFLLHVAFPQGDPPEDVACTRIMQQVIGALRQGRIATGNHSLVRAIDCLLKAIQAGRLVAAPPLPALLKAVVSAQTARDWVRVSDLLEYDLAAYCRTKNGS